MKIRGIRSLCGAFALAMSFMVSVPAVAEREPVIQWLMDEPVSMWDFGMLRLYVFVKHFWQEGSGLGTTSRSARFDPDRNRVIITFSLFKPFDKELCGIMLRETRREGRVKADGTPYPWHRENYSIYAGNFARSVPKGNEPDGYLRQIDKIIEVEVIMEGGSCKGPLISSEILYGK